jgi:carboxyl-terminal processing protease
MKSVKRAKFIFGISLVLALVSVGTAGFYYGRFTVAKESPSNIEGRDFSIFWDAYKELKDKYLGEVDPQKFIYGAISGAYQSTGDPYTVFFSPELKSEFDNELAGQLEGIGLKLGMLDNLPTVIAPIPNSPAAKAGIKSKDRVLKVDDFETENQPLDLVVAKIRGASGSKVKLFVQPAGTNSIKEYELTRERIEVKSVEASYPNKDTVLIKLDEFSTTTDKDFESIYQEASGKGVKNVILDLRGNPGGILESAINLAEYFLPLDKTILIEESKHNKQTDKVEVERGWQNTKLVVLVDGGSASASEILAGAIKDNNRGKLIGEKTFGKGVVQQLIDLKNGSSVKITVSKWLTPSGTDINKNGLSPDVEVKTPEDQNFSTYDPVVNRALKEF